MEITIKHQIELTPAVQGFLTQLLSGQAITKTADEPEFAATQVNGPGFANHAAWPHEPAADIQQTAYTVEQVREIVAGKTKGNPDNRDKVKGYLKAYGADSVTALSQDHYYDFVTQVNAL